MASKLVEAPQENLHYPGRRAEHRREAGALTIGFVNNMGAGGFRSAERQFRQFVALGADAVPCRFRHFTLTGLPALDGADRDCLEPYAALDEIRGAGIDALIVTGAEPRCDDMRDEPYWGRLVGLLDWAEAERVPVLLSCLAAHAAVLHRDGIARRPLPAKRSGIFVQRIVCDHPLTRGLGPSLAVPHSRWNEIEAAALEASGYTILTRAEDGGVDCFLKEGRNLVVGFQGHPEYGPETLFLEYRRDVRRFLDGMAERYPGLPAGYFSPGEAARLAVFRRRALTMPDAALFCDFPVEAPREPYAPSWQAHAAALSRNWLRHVEERR